MSIVSVSVRISTCRPPQTGSAIGLTTGAAAARARLRKHHVPARRLDDAGTLALRARRSTAGRRPSPRHVRQCSWRVTVISRWPPAHRLVEGSGIVVMQIGAALGRLRRRLARC